MIDKNIFFNEILVPKIIKNLFEQEEWYLIQRDLIEILEVELTERHEGLDDTIKLNGKVYIGEGTKISKYLIIDGPVYIGNNVDIGPFTWLRPGTVIGDDCSIASHAHLKNCVMMDKSKVANHASLLDSILGSRGRLGGGAETGNRRFDQESVIIKFESEEIDSKLVKYGAIIGEGTRLGGGVFTYPGVTIGKNSFVNPGTYLENCIPQNSFVKYVNNIEIRQNKFSGKLHNQEKFLV